MLQIADTLYYLFVLFGVLIFCFTAGSLFLRNTFSDFYADIFAKILTGSVLTVTVFALFRTGGLSFFLPAAGLFLLAEFLLKKIRNGSFYILPTARQITAILGFVVLAFGLRVSGMYDPESGLLSDYFGNEVDNLYYAQIADHLLLYGKENTQLGLNDFGDKGLRPYHYYELWFTGLCSSVFDLNTAYTFYLITQTFFFSLLFVGYAALISGSLKRSTFFIVCSAGALAFCSTIYSELFFEIPFLRAHHFIYGDHGNAFFTIKQTIPEVLILAVILLLVRKAYDEAFLTLLFLPCLSFLFFPSVMLLTGFWFLFHFFRPVFKYKIGFYAGALVLQGGGSLLIWYFNRGESVHSELAESFVFRPIIDYLFLIVSENVRNAGLYFPFSFFLLLFLPFLKKPYSLILFIWLAVASIFGLATEVDDWAQFYDMPAYGLLKIACIAGLFILAEKAREQGFNLKLILIYAAFAWLGFRTVRNLQLKTNPLTQKTRYSTEWLSSIEERITNDSSYTIGFYYSAGEQQQIYESSLAYMARFGTQSIYMKNGLHSVNLSSLDAEPESRLGKIVQANSDLAVFQTQNSNIATENLRLLFIRQKRIRYIFGSPAAVLPKNIQELVIFKTADPISKQIFYELK